MAQSLAISAVVIIACSVAAATNPQDYLSAVSVRSTSASQQTSPIAPSCPVTIGKKSPISPEAFFGSGSAHWNGKFYVGGLWPDGTIVFRPGGAGFTYADGSLGMKIGWYRAKGLHGALRIRGKRLDAPAPPLRANIPHSYLDTGFQSSEVIFPSEGCWQVTGTVAGSSVTFVTRVVRLQPAAQNFWWWGGHLEVLHVAGCPTRLSPKYIGSTKY